MAFHNTNLNINNSSKLQPIRLVNIPPSIINCIVNYSRNNSKESDIKGGLSITDTSTKVQCKICHKVYTHFEIDKFKQCKHTFCHECLHNYLCYKIKVGDQVKCPACKVDITSDPCFQRLPQSMKDRHSNLKKMALELKLNERVCQAEDCKGIVDFSRSRPQCSTCQKQYCKQCYLQYHGEEACRYQYYKNFLEWKRCYNCRVFLQQTRTCYHFGCQLPQSVCLVCIMGWSDKFHHLCKRQQQDPLLRDVFFRDSIMQSSWFLNILRGILLELALVFVFITLVTGFIIFFVLVVLVSLVIAPFIIVCRGISDGQYGDVALYFLCFPCAQVIAASFAVNQYVVEYTGSYVDWFITYLLTTKAMFYYNDTYKENLSSYSKMEVNNCFRRSIYFILMLLFLPLMLFLPFLLFIIASIFLLVFVLVTLPMIASIQKKIPIWVSILFYPIVFFHIITIDFGGFVRDQGKQIFNFYPQYFKTMYGYLCPKQEEETSLIQPQKHNDLRV